jgi:hypothetical protein
MFVNKLLTDVLNQNDEIIKGLDKALQSYPVRQEDDHRYLIFPELIKKIVLKTLALAVRH